MSELTDLRKHRPDARLLHYFPRGCEFLMNNRWKVFGDNPLHTSLMVQLCSEHNHFYIIVDDDVRPVEPIGFMVISNNDLTYFEILKKYRNNGFAEKVFRTLLKNISCIYADEPDSDFWNKMIERYDRDITIKPLNYYY